LFWSQKSNPRRSHDFKGRSALCEAAIQGNVNLIEALVKAGADVNRAVNRKCGKHFRYVGWSPVFAAASEGHVAAIEALVKAGADSTYAKMSKEKIKENSESFPVFDKNNDGYVDLKEATAMFTKVVDASELSQHVEVYKNNYDVLCTLPMWCIRLDSKFQGCEFPLGRAAEQGKPLTIETLVSKNRSQGNDDKAFLNQTDE
jgi:hypothetical protein